MDRRTPTLGARTIADAMVALARLLQVHQATINRLNVFPVPDGDTGTNMSLTVEAVVAEIGAPEDVAEGATAMRAVCDAISHGSLMGARGNSGVILCQVLRGIAGSFTEEHREQLGPRELADGLASGAKAAREAVLRPAEGTILSVADAAAAAATSAAEAGVGLVEVLEAARAGSVVALWRTPDQLPVLAQAGVVDAGGAGLVLLYDALLQAVDGRLPPDELELPPDVVATLSSSSLDPGNGRSHGESALAELRYEVMYLLHAPDEAMPAFKQVWAGIGDSIVVVGGDGLWNCHIHTDDIGAAIEAALDAGRPRDIRVTDLSEQVEEEQWVRQAEPAGPVEAVEGPAPVTSVVAVATGGGVQRIFRSLGVQAIVAGGQSMNPSTVEILAAIESVRGEEVVVLPNNSNIRPVAEQAAAIATKKVRVVATRGMQEGFAALLEYDPQASGDENAEAMALAAERVVAGEVTRAVRSSRSAAGPIEPGDFIGLSRSGVVAVAATLGEATCALLAELITADHEIVTLIEGHGVTAAQSRRVSEWLHEHHPGITVERHHGGQPLYPFLISIE
jgi:DAK2 domain fusion protein YloV